MKQRTLLHPSLRDWNPSAVNSRNLRSLSNYRRRPRSDDAGALGASKSLNNASPRYGPAVQADRCQRKGSTQRRTTARRKVVTACPHCRRCDDDDSPSDVESENSTSVPVQASIRAVRVIDGFLAVSLLALEECVVDGHRRSPAWLPETEVDGMGGEMTLSVPRSNPLRVAARDLPCLNDSDDDQSDRLRDASV